jgi:hypothetical protein
MKKDFLELWSLCLETAGVESLENRNLVEVVRLVILLAGLLPNVVVLFVVGDRAAFAAVHVLIAMLIVV